MNLSRRSFVRVAVGGVSAAVFSTAGWLMGTKSLGTSSPPPWPDPSCNCYAGSFSTCMRITASCMPGICDVYSQWKYWRNSCNSYCGHFDTDDCQCCCQAC